MENKKKEIKIITYNIFMRPYLIKTNDSDYKDKRLPLIAKYISSYDIVCLQEVFDNFTHRKHELLIWAKKLGFNYFAHLPNPDFTSDFIVDGGLLILSKFPILFSE
jgi:endonuclease/exonuclease/phosphatase family metal-dependent hydrolase